MQRSSRFIAISGLVFSLVAHCCPGKAYQRLGCFCKPALQATTAQQRPRVSDKVRCRPGAGFGFR